MCATPLYGPPLIIRKLVFSGQFRFPDEKLIYFLIKLNFFIRKKVNRDNEHSFLCLESQTLIYRQPRLTDAICISTKYMQTWIPLSDLKKNTRNDHEVSLHVPLVPVMITSFHCSNLEHFNNLKNILSYAKSLKKGVRWLKYRAEQKQPP